jgi:hypothetical protein
MPADLEGRQEWRQQEASPINARVALPSSFRRRPGRRLINSSRDHPGSSLNMFVSQVRPFDCVVSAHFLVFAGGLSSTKRGIIHDISQLPGCFELPISLIR